MARAGKSATRWGGPGLERRFIVGVRALEKGHLRGARRAAWSLFLSRGVSTATLPALPVRADVPQPLPRLRHLVWVTETAAFTGGAEHYVYETARLFAAEGIRNTLLYDPLSPFDTDFVRPFSRTYPLVAPAAQLQDLDADIVYAHRVSGAERWRELASASTRVVRFFHDHKPLCLREHKYTTLGSSTCTKTLGAHCYSCLGFIGRGPGGLALRTLGPLNEELEASRRLAGSVVASRYLRGHLVDHGFDPLRIHVAPLFARPPRALVVPRDAHRLAFVGQLVRGKGVDILLHAMARLGEDARLTIAGSGAQEAELKALALKLGLGHRVLFAGHLKGLDRDRVVASAAAVVMPSRAPETFGLSGLEALRHATPVVGARVGGIPEWLMDGETGLLFESGDVDGLAAALARILEAPAFARVLGEQGREAWRARFQPQHHMQKLTEAFARVIG